MLHACKGFNCNSANKSCLCNNADKNWNLQFLQSKAIAAFSQFRDFLCFDQFSLVLNMNCLLQRNFKVCKQQLCWFANVLMCT